MKRKTLVIIGEVSSLIGPKNFQIPTILGKTVSEHLFQRVAWIKPERIALVYERSPELNSEKLRKLVRLIKKKDGTLAQILSAANQGNFEGNLVLLSSDFYLMNSGFLLEALKAHQKSGNDLTLIAEKVHPVSGRRSEDYFVYPGLAVIRIKNKCRRLLNLRLFKPSGQLDVVSLAKAAGLDDRRIGFKWVEDKEKQDFILINKLSDFSQAAGILRRNKVAELEEKGVFFLSAEDVWIDLEVKIGQGTVIYPSVVIEGNTRIGQGCQIYPHCHIINSQIGDRVRVFSSTVIEGCRIEDEAQAGPFSRLRPETRLRRGCRVGNFVEMKKTIFGEGSKALHLSYLGDTTVEEKVNVGAGTITCNYDGVKKNKTYIEKEAFIGSGTELVAPVKVGRGAYIAAGSTITEDVSPEALAIARARQVEKPGWAKMKKGILAGKKRGK
jgi:bifunctional UDP-N-acetylglucosamine pyrophosphorylase/glucosamine-1-phosphate N-acetyltransferase